MFRRIANIEQQLNEANSTGWREYKLEGLGVTDSRSMFQTNAFKKDDPRDNEKEELGNKITRLCKGVPITIKVAARLLKGQQSINEWNSFYEFPHMLDEDNRNIMEQVLHLNYSYLPTRLKACFSYCSLFPEDFTFNKHDLISLWATQGYIDKEDSPSLKEAAEKYFFEFLRRCFFEVVSTDELGNIVTCKMNPIMHKLACQYTDGVNVNMYATDSSANQVLDSKH